MGTSTVSGPFRSANGFQELVNGQWVPVAGGGGGGGGSDVQIELATGGFSGTPANLYSEYFYANPPIGPTAGNIIQLPLIEVGQSYSFYSLSGSSVDAYAIQLPSIAGTDISSFYGPFNALVAPAGTYGTSVPCFANSASSGPNDLLYIYGFLGTILRITRIPNITIPGFGTIAFFQFSNTPTLTVDNNDFGDPTQYPFVNVLAP